MIQTPNTKQELVSYLGCIDLSDGQKLREKSDEIIENIRVVMKGVLERDERDGFRRDYELKLTELEEAHNQKDSKKLIHALAGLYNFLRDG